MSKILSHHLMLKLLVLLKNFRKSENTNNSQSICFLLIARQIIMNNIIKLAKIRFDFHSKAEVAQLFKGVARFDIKSLSLIARATMSF